MNDTPRSGSSGRGEKSDERDELRTISFRLREIQRLLSARVEQENRRLEAEGIEPVAGHGGSRGGEATGAEADDAKQSE